MPSVLDLRMDRAIADLSIDGGPLPLSTYCLPNGVEVPVITSAPPHLSAYFRHFCEKYADMTFIVDGAERISFGEAYAAAHDVAQSLNGSFGVKTGDRVGIAMRNTPAWIILYMGILMAGGVATLLNGFWQGYELCDGIDDVDAKLVFADSPRTKRIRGCGRILNCHIIEIDVCLPLKEALVPLCIRGVADAEPLPKIAPDDLATILFTSGSTGRSKGAYSSHRAVMQAVFCYIAQAMMQLKIYTEDGRIKSTAPPHALLMTVPMFHVTGEVPMLLLSFAVGRKIVMMPKWDALEAMRLIEAEKITNFTGVPLMSWEILNHPERSKFDLSSVQSFAAGGAPRPPEHVRRLNDELPAPPMLGYGLTETNAVGCGSFGDNYLAKPNSTGRVYAPYVELAILDEAGQSVAMGERGEVGIRSAANFSGYWNLPEATAASITQDGFFRTGDIGYLDSDGYLFIVDRKKDIIIRGGENVSCQEVEAVLYEHPIVAEACVFGLPDDRLGEVPGAVIYCQSGAEISEDELTLFLGERLAAFKVPVQIWVLKDPLPRLGTEKIDKVILRSRFAELYLKG